MRRPLVDFNLTSEQLEQMFAPSNELTIKSWEKRWMDNIVENLQLHPTPRSGQELLTNLNRHVVLACGAGPSLRKLRKRAHLIPPEWGIICVDSAVKAVLEAGLRPTLVVTMDGDNEGVASFGDTIHAGFDMLAAAYPETPVLTDLVACPSIVEKVRNPYFFRSVGDPAHILGRFVARECPHILQMGHGGNVGSVCLIMAKFFCFARHVVILGLDSAMKEGSTRNGYWDNRMMPEIHQYLDVCDIYGRPITTMANLHNYKWWADHFCFFNDDVEWINANDGGFLGVCGPNENYNHFKYLTLEQAVEHLRDHGEDD